MFSRFDCFVSYMPVIFCIHMCAFAPFQYQIHVLASFVGNVQVYDLKIFESLHYCPLLTQRRIIIWTFHVPYHHTIPLIQMLMILMTSLTQLLRYWLRRSGTQVRFPYRVNICIKPRSRRFAHANFMYIKRPYDVRYLFN